MGGGPRLRIDHQKLEGQRCAKHAADQHRRHHASTKKHIGRRVIADRLSFCGQQRDQIVQLLSKRASMDSTLRSMSPRSMPTVA